MKGLESRTRCTRADHCKKKRRIDDLSLVGMVLSNSLYTSLGPISIINSDGEDEYVHIVFCKPTRRVG